MLIGLILLGIATKLIYYSSFIRFKFQKLNGGIIVIYHT